MCKRSAKHLAFFNKHCVKLQETDGRVSLFVCLFVRCVCRVCILCGEQTAMLHRNLGGIKSGSTNKYTKFGQLIIRKLVKIIATRCHILRLKCTKFDSRHLSVHSSVRLCLDTVDDVDTERWRRSRWTLLLCVFFRPSFRWSLTLYKHRRRTAKLYSLSSKKPQFRFSVVLAKNAVFGFGSIIVTALIPVHIFMLIIYNI